ncbi:hypothetical protein KIW84_011730 [Lathyrus oleraceus]|uniref:Uncharacterized protein n=1 Tax=Pisum sativum TaxID=3888 RepID=A0A9D5BFU7_PEA|nr:hypothetical protein KIW84_011730 [Pisum sativum]
MEHTKLHMQTGIYTSGRQSAFAHIVWSNQTTCVSRTIDQYSSDSPRHVQLTLNNFVVVSKRKHDDIITALSEVLVLGNQAPHHQLKTANTETNDSITRSYIHLDQINETSKLSQIENSQQQDPASIKPHMLYSSEFAAVNSLLPAVKVHKRPKRNRNKFKKRKYKVEEARSVGDLIRVRSSPRYSNPVCSLNAEIGLCLVRRSKTMIFVSMSDVDLGTKGR